jgi:hypothetical protein
MHQEKVEAVRIRLVKLLGCAATAAQVAAEASAIGYQLEPLWADRLGLQRIRISRERFGKHQRRDQVFSPRPGTMPPTGARSCWPLRVTSFRRPIEQLLPASIGEVGTCWAGAPVFERSANGFRGGDVACLARAVTHPRRTVAVGSSGMIVPSLLHLNGPSVPRRIRAPAFL